MTNNIQFHIENDGDDDANLWTVLDDKGNVYFSTRNRSQAERYMSEAAIYANTPDVQTELIETEIVAAELEAPPMVFA